MEDKIKKVSIIISKGGLDGVYPGLIMANGARMEGIEASLAKLGTLENFVFLSGIDEAALIEAYQRSHLLYLPLSDSTANLGLLEGMSCGVPVVGVLPRLSGNLLLHSRHLGLVPPQEKEEAELLAEWGVDRFHVFRFTREFAALAEALERGECVALLVDRDVDQHAGIVLDGDLRALHRRGERLARPVELRELAVQFDERAAVRRGHLLGDLVRRHDRRLVEVPRRVGHRDQRLRPVAQQRRHRAGVGAADRIQAGTREVRHEAPAQLRVGQAPYGVRRWLTVETGDQSTAVRGEALDPLER